MALEARPPDGTKSLKYFGEIFVCSLLTRGGTVIQIMRPLDTLSLPLLQTWQLSPLP
jgi:hypothetical protein